MVLAHAQQRKALLSICLHEEAGTQPNYSVTCMYRGATLSSGLCALQNEATTEPTGKRAKSYSMCQFREALTGIAYSFMDFYSNSRNMVGVFFAGTGENPSVL